MQVNPDRILQEYRQKIRTEKIYVFVVQLLILICAVSLWELASMRGWINPLLFSQPTKVWALFLERLTAGTLLPHVYITVMETVVGFIMGTLIGTVLATIIWWSPFLDKVLEPYLVVLNSMPKVALGPIFIVGLGSGFVSIMAMALAITVIITTIVIYTGFKEVDPNYIRVVKSFGASRKQVFQKVILPANFPTILSTFKVNVGLAWVGVIVGEFLVAQQGLGYLIIYGFQVFNFTLVFMSLMIVICFAALMYHTVYYIEQKLLNRL